MQPKKLGLSLLCATAAHAAPQDVLPTTVVYVTRNVSVPAVPTAPPLPTVPIESLAQTLSTGSEKSSVISSIKESLPPKSYTQFTVSSEAGHIEISASGWYDIPTTSSAKPKSQTTSAAIVHVEISKTGYSDGPTGGFNEPTKPSQTNAPTTRPNGKPTLTQYPGDTHVSPTPIYTVISTVVNSQTTQVPVYIIPGYQEHATLGQTITMNGETTVLAPPSAHFTTVDTTIDGVPTVVPVYVISGSSTVPLGKTLTLNGQATVLAPPRPRFTTVSTTIDGVATEVPVYILSGTSTASLGQTVTLDGTVSVLSTPTRSGIEPETTETQLVARGAKMGRMRWSAAAVGGVGAIFGWM